MPSIWLEYRGQLRESFRRNSGRKLEKPWVVLLLGSVWGDIFACNTIEQGSVVLRWVCGRAESAGEGALHKHCGGCGGRELTGTYHAMVLLRTKQEEE